MCLADNKVVEPSTEAQTDAVPTRLGNVSCEFSPKKSETRLCDMPVTALHKKLGSSSYTMYASGLALHVHTTCMIARCMSHYTVQALNHY